MSKLRDIATELDVSVSLVSKVLNHRLGTSGASPETVREIKRLARRINYQKNAGAAALATGRQNAIGLFMHRIGVDGSAISDCIIRGVSDRLRSEGIRLVLNFFETFDEFQRFRPHAGPHSMDGVITAGIPHIELVSELREIAESGLPVVTLHDRPVDPAFTNVGSDQAEVGRLATAHLIERGCRRIAHIQVDVYRTKGYRTALTDAMLPYRDDMLYTTKSYQIQSGRDAVAHFDQAGIEYDGLVAQSDSQAAGVVYELLRRGKRVPEDVKVTGVDNSPLCEAAFVPLTSVDCDRMSQGTIGVDCLLRLLSKQEVTSTAVHPRLAVRLSSGG